MDEYQGSDEVVINTRARMLFLGSFTHSRAVRFLQTVFVTEEVSNIIKECVEAAIGGMSYQHSKVNQWSSNIVDQCLSHLAKLNKPFKYIVTCTIVQKNGAGLHLASSCFWDNTTDGSCTVRWENKTIYCIVSVFGLAI